MSKHLGDFPIDAIVDFKWSTNDANGGSISPGSPSGGIAVYIGNSAGQFTDGITLTEDFDGVIGVHHVRIDLSASPYYQAGSECQVVLIGAEISGQSVNAVLAEFSIQRAGAALALLLGTDGLAALREAIGAVGSVIGSALSIDAAADNTAGGIPGVTSGTTFVGTQSSGTIADTSAQDLIYQVITGVGNALDIVYQFQTGVGTVPVSCQLFGYVTSSNDEVIVSVWDFLAGAWEAMATIPGTNGTTNYLHNCPLFGRNMGSGAEDGNVYMRLHCSAQSAPVLHVDQVYVSYGVEQASSATVDAIKAKTDNLPTDPADESLVIAATTAIYDRIGAPTGASIAADVATVDGNVDAVKAKTDQLTFTAGEVDANVERVLGQQIQTNGSASTNWGAAP